MTNISNPRNLIVGKYYVFDGLDPEHAPIGEAFDSLKAAESERRSLNCADDCHVGIAILHKNAVILGRPQ